MKALVVDDDLISRLVLERVLSRFGKVDSCGDGPEAVRACRLALAQGDPYHLICMDLMMPGMSGIEALRAIREEEDGRGKSRAAKVIVITGSEDSGSVDEAFQHLCDAYIVKPIDAENFLNVLDCICPVAEQ